MGRAGSVEVDTADVEAGVGRGGNDRHEVPVFGGRHRSCVLLPRLTGRHEQDILEVEERLDLSGSHEVTVMDGIEGPAHDSDAPAQWWAPGSAVPCGPCGSPDSPWRTRTGVSYLAAVLRKVHSTPSRTRKDAKATTP